MLWAAVDKLCGMSVSVSFLLTLRDAGRSRANLRLEVLALGHQLHVLKRSQARRLRLTRVDGRLWVWFARAWRQWRDAVVSNNSIGASEAPASSKAASLVKSRPASDARLCF